MTTQPTDPRPASPVGGEARERALQEFYDWLDEREIVTVDGDEGLFDRIADALSAPSVTGEAVAWLRDAHQGEGDECLVPAAKGDPGAFPVFAHGEGSLLTAKQFLAQAKANLADDPDLGAARKSIEQALAALSPTAVEGGSGACPAKEPVIPTEREDGAVVAVQRMVSQIVLDLRLRGYVSQSGDPNWAIEAAGWDRIGARVFGLAVCPSCARFDGHHDADCACQPMSDEDSASFEQSTTASAVGMETPEGVGMNPEKAIGATS